MAEQHLECAREFARTLLALAECDDRICVVLNDSTDTNYLEPFLARFPNRVIDVGIAEQNMVGVAAGIASTGRVPFVHSASCFLTARAMEQIKIDVAYNNLNVKLCGFVSGLAYGACGGSHHAVEDIAWMRAIPRLRVLVPCTPNETAAVVKSELLREGPAFIRVISKVEVPELFPLAQEFAPSAWVRKGKDVALIGTGLLTTRLYQAADMLSARGIEATVLHLGSVSPIDAEAVIDAAKLCRRVVVAEDHVLNGGLGGAVSEVLIQNHPVPALLVGIPNVYAPIGSASYLHEHFGFTPDRLAARIEEWLGALKALKTQ